MMAVTRQSDQEIWHQEVKERAKELGEITQRLLERNRNDPRLSGRIEEYKAIREVRAPTRDAEVIPLIYAGKTEEARALTLGIHDEHYRKLRAIAQELGETAVENIKQASVQNVSGTRPAEVAAQQLHELGQRLKQLAAQYKV
jgi:hypothetical protein